ncbi:mitochondrial fission ELM1 family protein [Litorimonas sp. RW-G-Af-16]|uniref:mitochondrial fission ELM1 family protein n=1 Tax=Litorimonas sp. RW-G-Af-16 TaxID=3241168 RepID=UPI00390C849E
MAAAALNCWVISDGRRGIENQALGLAEAMSQMRPLKISKHHTTSSAIFQALPPLLQLSMRGSPAEFGLPQTVPNLVIGCGRQAIAPLLAIKKHWPESFTVYVQDPRIDPKRFDLVIAPEHDALSGPNVETMIGSPNRATRDRIAGETLEMAAQLKPLPMPRAAFLIGGDSKSHTLTEADCKAHLLAAEAFRAAGHSVLVSTSRRTPNHARAAWREFARQHKTVWLYDSAGNTGEPNPYFAFLGGGDVLLVTQDSTNMLTEACSTGKPVFTLPMQGKSGKFIQLYQALTTRCGVVPWAGQMSGEDYPALDETTRIAEQVWAHMDSRGAVLN